MMKAIVINHHPEKINFENKMIYHNIIIKSKHNKSVDYTPRNEINKESLIKWAEQGYCDFKLNKSNEFREKISESDIKKHRKGYKSIDDYVNRKNGLHNLLNLYLISDNETDMNKDYPKITSRYGKSSRDFNLTNKTAINFYKSSNEREKDEKPQPQLDKTTPLNCTNAKKIAPNETSSKKLVERSTQVSPRTRASINILDLSKRSFLQDRSDYFDRKEMLLVKSNTKEDFYYFNRDNSNQMMNPLLKTHKYRFIPVINETLQKMMKVKDDHKQTPILPSNSINNGPSSVLIPDFNNNSSVKIDQSEKMRRTNYFHKLTPFQKAFQPRNNKKIEKDKKATTLLHQREIFLNDDCCNKSLRLNHHTNHLKCTLIPKSTRTSYKGSLFHAKRQMKLSSSCNNIKKKQIIQINHLELGETQSKFLFSAMNVKNKGPRLAPRMFEYNYS